MSSTVNLRKLLLFAILITLIAMPIVVAQARGDDAKLTILEHTLKQKDDVKSG